MLNGLEACVGLIQFLLLRGFKATSIRRSTGANATKKKNIEATRISGTTIVTGKLSMSKPAGGGPISALSNTNAPITPRIQNHKLTFGMM